MERAERREALDLVAGQQITLTGELSGHAAAGSPDPSLGASRGRNSGAGPPGRMRLALVPSRRKTVADAA